MSETIEVEVPCPRCNKYSMVSIYTSVNVSVNPSLKKKVFSGDINKRICPNCAYKFEIVNKLLYHDMDNQFAIWYDPDGIGFANNKINFDNYIFDAPVAQSWSHFLAQIILFENKILLIKKEKRLLQIRQRTNSVNFSEGLIYLRDDLQMKQKLCKNCGKSDFLFGLSECCTYCGNNILEFSFDILEFGFEILRLFCSQFNESSKDIQEELFNLIDIVIIDYRFFNKFEPNKLKEIRKILQRMRMIGNRNIFFKIENEDINVIINKDTAESLDIKMGNDKDAVIFIFGSINYILNFPLQKNDL
ncbi:MAG: CpXC domain-containing protein [Bacteroidota bacterium]|nr:CpXC domain-containing protein [Bacteroidota bacterium]